MINLAYPGWTQYPQHWGLKELSAHRSSPQSLSGRIILDQVEQIGLWGMLSDHDFSGAKLEYHFRSAQSRLLHLKNVHAKEITFIGTCNKTVPKFVKLEDCAIEQLNFQDVDLIRCKHLSNLQHIKAVNSQDLVLEDCDLRASIILNNRLYMDHLRVDKEIMTRKSLDQIKSNIQFCHLLVNHL